MVVNPGFQAEADTSLPYIDQPPPYDQLPVALASSSKLNEIRTNDRHAQETTCTVPMTSAIRHCPTQQNQSNCNAYRQYAINYGQYLQNGEVHPTRAPQANLPYVTVVDRTVDTPVNRSFKKDILIFIYSVIAVLFCFILGMAAIIYSTSAMCFREVNVWKAESHSNIALKLSHASIVCGLILYGAILAFMVMAK
ncbi:uncharacterized protein [Ptychodera flava]|uniref:uncharacterized protein n=1 Tax=Ptychodera flava TaxID=63121 RepID=UPI003969BCD6